MLTGERAPPLHHQNGDPLRHSLPPELRRVPAAMPKKTLPRRPRHFAVAKVHLTPEGGRQRARGSAARPSLLQKTRPRHPPPRLEQKCSIQSTKKGTPSKAHSHSRQRQRRQRRWPKPPSPLTGTLAGAPPSSARSKNTCRAALSSALPVRQPGPSGYRHNATIDSATLLKANSPSSPAMARAPSLARRQATAPGAHGRRMI